MTSLSKYEFHNYPFGKGGYNFSSVSLFVCLCVSNITQKVVFGLVWFVLFNDAWSQ